jgi:chaperonin GroES
MALKLRPLADRVVVEPLEQEETFAGGQLVLPETAKEKPQQGKVLAVGDGRLDENGQRIPLDVKVDDKVLYARYGGTEVKIDVLAVVDYGK